MTTEQELKLGAKLWEIANTLRGAMSADDFRDYMLSFIFLKYLSDNYENEARRELGSDFPDTQNPLKTWYAENDKDDTEEFEKVMRSRVFYVIAPDYLWSNISELARTQSKDLLSTLDKAFTYIEEKSFEDSFKGLFSEIHLNSEKLGKTHADKNALLCEIISTLSTGLKEFSQDEDILGDAYEYLIGQFAAGGGKKAGEFYTPQTVSTILSKIVTLDCQDTKKGKRENLGSIMDMTCGSGSLLLNVAHEMGKENVTRIYGQEKNITTYNLARMNMLLHGVKDSNFSIFHGDTLKNEWDILSNENPSKKIEFDAIVANPPFSLSWTPTDTHSQDARFKNHGVAPKSAADFAFLLHGFHYLKDSGTMAIVLPHGVLFRGGNEGKIRQALLKSGNIDTVIGLPPNLFYSTSIPVCIIVLKKCKNCKKVLFINAAEHFEKAKKKNNLRQSDIEKIIETYTYRVEEDKYSRLVDMKEIEENDYNLNISRYVSTAEEEEQIDLISVHEKLLDVQERRKMAIGKHNVFLKELGLPLL